MQMGSPLLGTESFSMWRPLGCPKAGILSASLTSELLCISQLNLPLGLHHIKGQRQHCSHLPEGDKLPIIPKPQLGNLGPTMPLPRDMT